MECFSSFLKVLRLLYLPEDEKKLKGHHFRTEENIFLYDQPTESVGVAALL